MANDYYKTLQYYLINSKVLFNQIIVKIQPTIQTRKSIKISTSSCRNWQLTYAILCLYADSRKFNIYADEIIFTTYDIQDFKLLYNKIIKRYYAFTFKNMTPFYQIVFGNINNIDYIHKITGINDLIHNNDSPYTNHYMCIYIKDMHNISLIPYGIIHYFTLIYIVSLDRYYINTAWSSDILCSPQTTIELDIDEFNNFCNNTLDESFLRKYFLTNCISVKPDAEYFESDIFSHINKTLLNKKRKYDIISYEYGIEYTINEYLTNNYDIGIINDYEKMIKNELHI